MHRRFTQLTAGLGATLGTIAFVGLAPAGTASAATPAPRDLICELLGTCPAAPDDDTVVVIDLEGVGTAVGTVVDTTVETLDTVLPGTAGALGGLPAEQLPAPLGGVVGGVTGGAAAPTLEVVTGTAETVVNGALDDATDVVDETLNQVGLGDVVAAEARIPVDLTDGVVVAPTAGASVDLGGATSAFPVPLPELLDADVAASLCGVNVVVLADHDQDCSSAAPAPATIGTPLLGDVKLPIDVCGVQVVVLGSDNVDCSGSGGNQNGGATGALSDALAGIGAAVGLCGVQVGVLGSAAAECTGRDNGVGGGVCLTPDLCIDLPGVGTGCGIVVGVGSELGVDCAAGSPGGPGTPGDPDDPDDTPEAVDPGDDPGDTPEGVGGGGDDDGTGGTDDGTGGGTGADGDGDGIGQPGGIGGGGDGGGSGTLPLTGLSVGSLLGLGGVLIATGVVARRVRGFAAVR